MPVRWIIAFAVLSIAFSAEGAPARLRAPTTGAERQVRLRDFAAAHGLRVVGPTGKHLELVSPWTRLRFEAESRQVYYNGILLWLHAPVRAGSHWIVSETDVRKVLTPLLRRQEALRNVRAKVIVLDPGHGGIDRGATSRRGVEEKALVLDIARRARVHLANAGFKVYLTRDNDRFLDLEQRTEAARAWNADVLVSIHLNAGLSATARGVETYVMAVPGQPPTSATPGARIEAPAFPGNRFDAANTVLGYFLHRALIERLKAPDRGLRRARFVVLKTAPCPAVLLECGFLSHPTDANLLITATHREAIALAIAKGIMDYAAAVREAQAPTR